MSHEKKIENTPTVARKRRGLRWLLFKILLVFLIILNALGIVLNSPMIQKRVSTDISKYISNKTGYKVSLNEVSLNINKGIQLKDFLINDLNNDTLISAGSFNTSLIQNIISMVFLNEYDFSIIELENAFLNNQKKEGETRTSLQDFIYKLSLKKNKNSKKNCTKLNIGDILLSNVRIVNDLYDKPIYENIKIGRAKLVFNKLGLCDKIIDIESIIVEDPKVQIVKRKNAILDKKNDSKPTDLLIDLGFELKIGVLNIKNGVFGYKTERNYNPIKKSFKTIDFKNVAVTNLDVLINNLKSDSLSEMSFSINDISFKEKSGFQVKSFGVKEGIIKKNEIILSKLNLKTLNSSIVGDVKFGFRSKNDFKHFIEKVKISGDFSNSRVRFRDILFFAPKVKETSVFVENMDRNINFKGRVSGPINLLKSKKFRINIDNKFKILSGFVLKDITKKGQEFLDIYDMNLVSSSQYIMSMFKRVNFGGKFPKLGKLDYKGSFNGYLKDFNTFGNLNTDLGEALFDLKMNFNESVDYNGHLMLTDFDLGKLLGNDKIGKVGIKAKLTEGHGLVSLKSNAKVKASLDSIEFKGYKYRNVDINAFVNSSKFNGDLSITDKNIELSLNGVIDVEDSVPIYDLEAKLKNVDLYALNLYKKNLKVSCDVKMDFMGANTEEFSGKVFIDDLILSNGIKSVKIDSLDISSVKGDNQERYIDIDSDLFSFYFDGKYKLKSIPDAIYNIFDRNFSKFVDGLNKEKVINEDFDSYYYDFNLNVTDSKDLIEVLTGKMITLHNLNLDGSANHKNDSIFIKLNMDTCYFNNNNLVGLKSEFNLYQGYGDINLFGKSIDYKGSQIKNILFNTDVEQDELYFQTSIDSIGKKIRDISLSGKTVPFIDSFGIEVYGGVLTVIKEQLEFVGQNKIVLGKEYINLVDFVIKDDESKISIKGINGNRGIRAEIDNFDIGVINVLTKYDRLNFTGKTNGFVEVPDVFKGKSFESDLAINDLKINDEFFGEFKAKAKIDTVSKNKIDFSAQLGEVNPKLFTKGYYNTKDGVFYGDFKFDKFPLSFLEFIIVDGISNTQGDLSAHMRVFGPFKKVSITGNGRVDNGQTTVDYIGVPYYFDKQKFTLNDKGIDMTGVVIKDQFGNEGYASGGITYDRFKHWGVDVVLKSDNIMALNTTEKQNPDYWGTAVGKLDATFKGKFNKIVSMKIDATTTAGTKLTIPVKLYVDSAEKSFINYTNSKKIEKTKKKIKGEKGIEFDLKVKITEEADLKIIMDPGAGDNLVGNGTGLMRLLVKQDGEIEMFGDYKFTSGKYLFTLFEYVNKEFDIKEGSSIIWSGDPFEAAMDIVADYKANRISMNNLLAGHNLVQRENYKGDVTLKLLLTGTLNTPEIDFDFDIENLDNSVKSYVVSSLQELKSTPNALSTQVVGLLVFGSFLPDANLVGNLQNNNFLASGGANTISEYISTKLSNYVTSILSEVIDNSKYISGIDFSLDSKNGGLLSEIPQKDLNYVPQYHYLNTTLWFMDNKIKVQFGTDYTGKADFANRDNFISGGNVTVEIYMTENRHLKMKVFFRREFDELENQWENKSGVGVSYGSDFGKLYKKKE